MAQWPKGQSGNPNGRPPKSRALTAILERSLASTIDTDRGKVARKRRLAELVAEFATTGQVKLSDKLTLTAESVTDWAGVVKWIYQHVDGPPVQEVDVTSGGKPITVAVVKMPVDDL